MIFVTVGGQMGFDRLVRGVDSWCGARGRADVFAQVGPTRYAPEHMRWVRRLDAADFAVKMQCAAAIVSHAGMGTILTSLQLGKPILVMPRLGRLQETRNDHQVDTVGRLKGRAGVSVVMDETDLSAALDGLSRLKPPARVSAYASDELLQTVRSFIHER